MPTKFCTFRLDPTLVASVDAEAEALGWARADAVREGLLLWLAKVRALREDQPATQREVEPDLAPVREVEARVTSPAESRATPPALSALRSQTKRMPARHHMLCTCADCAKRKR